MHIYKIYNSLTLDQYKYDNEMNAFLLGGLHADKLVDKVGDIQLYYSENIDDSDWIKPDLIKEILLNLTASQDIKLETSNHILNLIKNNELIPRPSFLNSYGCKWFESNEVESQIIEIDIRRAENQAIRYYQKNKGYKWIDTLTNEKRVVMHEMMI